MAGLPTRIPIFFNEYVSMNATNNGGVNAAPPHPPIGIIGPSPDVGDQAEGVANGPDHILYKATGKVLSVLEFPTIIWIVPFGPESEHLLVSITEEELTDLQNHWLRWQAGPGPGDVYDGFWLDSEGVMKYGTGYVLGAWDAVSVPILDPNGLGEESKEEPLVVRDPRNGTMPNAGFR
ncbi:hypothetical protein BDV12DRAFT_200655 [Aspergillus spectabilis]